MASATLPTSVSPPPALPGALVNGPSQRPAPPSDDRHHEFLNGQWVEKAASTRSISLGFKIAYRLQAAAEPRKLGQAIGECYFTVATVADPGRMRKPDAAFVSSERWPL